jgi:hypothetical protein
VLPKVDHLEKREGRPGNDMDEVAKGSELIIPIEDNLGLRREYLKDQEK